MRQSLIDPRTTVRPRMIVNCTTTLLIVLVIYAIASNRLNQPLYLAAILACFVVNLVTYVIVCQHRKRTR